MAKLTRTYGFTCFSCKKELDIPIRGRVDYRRMEQIAGEAGWCIGHWDGEGQYVCGECKDTIWDAFPLGDHPALPQSSAPDRGEG